MAGQGAELVSVITDYGEHASTCGYCGTRKSGGAKGSVSHGMMAERLSVEVYQQLLDRGWRRSGRWVYYPLHECSCCQLVTIRLDVTKFQPNKDQRRVQRRWQAYLDGAPLRTQQHAQQPADAAAQQQQQQQQQQGGGGGGSEWQQQDFGAVVSRSDDVAGGSPKRMHEELEPLGPSAGQLPAAAAGSLLQANGLQGGGKRHRHAAEGADAEDAETARGASPAAQLSQHLQQALGSAAMAVDSPRQQPTEQQQQWAGAAQPSAAAAAAAGGTPTAELAAQLAAALQQSVAAGELPAAAYPPPKVQQPSVRQRKLLPPGVTLTSAFPLAVAAAAAKAAAAAGSGSSTAANTDAVAALLVRRLPPAVAAAAEVAKGHLNFVLAAAAPSEAAAAAAGEGAVNNSRQKGAQQAQQSKKQQAQQAQQQQQVQHQRTQQQQAQQAQQQQGIPRGVPRHFELRTLPSSDPSLVQAEFRLFKKYQVVHHGDRPGEVTQSSFRNFLIDSPLVHQGPEQFPQGGCPSTGFGSFHQQYWLDGVLVAVGVVDVLPRCLSSKYLFWDPDLGPLSLGKLTSLAEIEWVRREQADRCSSLRYYYLGFYIHNCHRMRYKGDFAPSDLLCPKNKCWVPLARVQSALEQPGMVAISELPGALAGLGTEYRVDQASGQATCPPRLPTADELAEQQLQLHLPATRGSRQPRVFTLGQLRGAGMLRAGPAADQFAATLGKWWSRAGPAAAAATAYAID